MSDNDSKVYAFSAWGGKHIKIFTVLTLLWIGGFLQCNFIYALDPNKSITQYIHDVWKMDDGLPQNVVTEIVQARKGYIWLGTQEGLVRFDGVQFTVYDKKNTVEIKKDYIIALFEDREENLWIGTYGGGLVRFKNGKFTSYTTKDGLSNDTIWKIFEDRKGNLWIGTSKGLSRFKNGKFTVYTTKDGLSNDFVRAIIEDRNGNLWIGTYGGGLNLFKNGEFTTYTMEDGLSNNIIWSIYEDREGSLWIGTTSGLNRYRNGRFTIYTKQDGLYDEYVLEVLEDRDGNLWIGTYGGGLNRFKNGKFTAFTTKEGLSNDLTWSLIEDQEGSLWVGTFNGLNRLRDGNFTVYSTKEGLSNDYVLSIYEDELNNFWIGTSGGGLNLFKDGEFTAYTMEEGLSNNIVWSITEDQEGTLWIGTNSGLNRLKDGRFTVFTTKDGLPDNQIWVIHEDKEGSLWVGTNNGLSQLRNGKFINYTREDGLSGNVIREIHKDREGNLWVASEEGGLNRWENGTFKVYAPGEKKTFHIITCIYEDEEETLWIGTYNEGLSRLKDGKLTTFTTKEGLYNDIMYKILEDGNGNLWMSCNKGIFRVNKKELNDFADNKVRSINSASYGKADGMKSLECNGGSQPAGWKRRDGKLCFPTVEGFVIIDPENIKLNEQPPPVIIEKAFVDEEPIRMDQKIELLPGAIRFEIQYAALSFIASERIQFKFKLEGFEEDWLNVGTRRTAYYNSIPPGHYVFRVKACNNDNVWNEKGASLEFYLKPYFYKTLLFYLICGLGLVGMSLGGYRFRMRQMKARERSLSLLVKDRTMELNNVMKHLERTNQELEQLSFTDRLTDVANRRHFETILDQEWRRCLREKNSLSLIMVDIDFFKAYNDTYGHPKGDECLKQVAGVLKNLARRPGDLAARYGGEEFVVILSNTDSRGANTVAEKMRMKIEELHISHSSSSVSSYVTISAGIATTIPDRSVSVEMLISASDQALYQAKQKGRNCVLCMMLHEKS